MSCALNKRVYTAFHSLSMTFHSLSMAFHSLSCTPRAHPFSLQPVACARALCLGEPAHLITTRLYSFFCLQWCARVSVALPSAAGVQALQTIPLQMHDLTC